MSDHPPSIPPQSPELEFLARDARHCLDDLRSTWPHLFVGEGGHLPPLGRSVNFELLYRRKGRWTALALYLALRAHCRRPAYLTALRTNATRMDLAGYDDGSVTAEEARAALALHAAQVASGGAAIIEDDVAAIGRIAEGFATILSGGLHLDDVAVLGEIGPIQHRIALMEAASMAAIAAARTARLPEGTGVAAAVIADPARSYSEIVGDVA